MDSLFTIYVLLGLFFVIIAELLFIIFLINRESKEKSVLIEQNAKLQAALIAKSASEYTAMRTMDKVIEKEPENPPGAVDMSELDDETYDKMIKEQLKTGSI